MVIYKNKPGKSAIPHIFQPQFTTSTMPSSASVETQTSFFNDDESVVTSVPEETTTLLEETTAESVTLPPEICPELQCLDGTCLSLSQLNNGVKDCSDGTDEQDFDELLS